MPHYPGLNNRKFIFRISEAGCLRSLIVELGRALLFLVQRELISCYVLPWLVPDIRRDTVRVNFLVSLFMELLTDPLGLWLLSMSSFNFNP